MSGRLGDLFREVVDLSWSEFREREKDGTITNEADAVYKLVRATRRKRGGLRATKEAINRLDGKVAEKIEVEYPKFYFVYPNASSSLGETENTLSNAPSEEEVLPAVADEPEEPPTGSVRAMVEKMLIREKTVPLGIIQAADQIDVHGYSDLGNPKVSAVIAAGLFEMTDSNPAAIYEIFEQIDGKVADKYKVLGDDIYITKYDEIAPVGAYKNDKGMWQIEIPNVTSTWALKLEQGRK